MATPKSDKTSTAPIYTIENPEEFSRNMLRVLEQGGRAFSEYLQRSDNEMGPYSAASEVGEISKTVTDVFGHWMGEPARFVDAQGRLFQSYAEVWNNCAQRMMGEDIAPVIEPEPGDQRFSDPEWSTNPYFDFWKQAYLVTSKWAEGMLDEAEGLDDRQRHRAKYHFQQLISAFSPSNFPMTNPEVVRETITTNAENLVNGMELFAKDMNKSGDLLRISQTDADAFEVGENLAVTPGKVIFQNQIFQLVQYAPTTERVRKTPLLIVPPWINKFYILDLTPAKSYIKFAVDQGLTVFVVSWVNPDETMADVSFEDYMHDGLIEAIRVVREETGEDKINTLGYCVGGTLLATTLAYQAARDDHFVRSCTFLTTQVDFTNAGDLLVFIDDAQLKSLEQIMGERGFLDGSRMANVFNMMRPRDLIWPYIVNNYLMGRKPLPFDLLYWNQDSTRMPAANHRYYLREFYHENRLAKGDMELNGTRLSLGKIIIPVFDLATRDDHIAPAKSVFTGSKLFSGPVEFVLAGSGHIAGVVNPPAKMKYQFWTASKAEAETLDEWIGMARERPGSWWPYWAQWVEKYSGAWIDAREPGACMGTLEDAPGSYVKLRT